MATPPGFSVSELIAAIAVAKRVYDSFYHTYERAPAIIRELTETLRYFRDTLIEVEAILRPHGTFYHGHLAFTRKLEECEAFLKEYSELRPEDATTVNEMRQTALGKVRRVWQTMKMAFDDAAARLRDGLSMELNKLTNFLIVFILKATVPGTEIAILGQRLAISSNRPSASRGSDIENFWRSVRQLQDVRDSYSAELNLAQQSSREPDFSAIYPVLENAWYLLCRSVGFTRDSTPPLQREGLLQPSQPSISLAIASLLGSENSLDEIKFPSIDEQSRTNNRIGLVTIKFSMKTKIEINPKSHKMAEIIERHSLEFQSYSFSQDAEVLIFTWSDQVTSSVLRHYVPMKVFPHTMHRETRKPLQITFLENKKHRIVLEKHNEIELDSTPMLIEYNFTLETQYQIFQEDLRNKNLLKTLEFHHIKSKRSGKLYEAENQDIKLWRSRDHHQLHSLSFSCSLEKGRHIEFPICWFDGKMDCDRRKLTVELYFVRRLSRSLPAINSRKLLPFLPQFSLRKTKSKETPPAPPIAPIEPVTPVTLSPLHSPQASLYNIETSSIHSNDHRFAPSDIANDLDALFIKFTSFNHYKTFVEMFDELYKLDTPSETFAPLSSQLALIREDPGERPDRQFL